MALAEAQSLAVGRDHQYIEPVHMLLALLDQKGGTVRHLLSLAQANVNGLRSRLGEELEKLPQVQGKAGDVHLSADMGRLLNVADKLAQQRKDQYISSGSPCARSRGSRTSTTSPGRKSGRTAP